MKLNSFTKIEIIEKQIAFSTKLQSQNFLGFVENYFLHKVDFGITLIRSCIIEFLQN